MLLLRWVVHAWLSLYIICFSRDVCSLVILYSFSQPHITIVTTLCICSIPLALLVISCLPYLLLVVSCSPYSSYPARLTRRIPFTLLVVSRSPYSSYLPDCFISSYFGEHEVGWCLRFHWFFCGIVCRLSTEYCPSLILCVDWNAFLCDFLSFRLVCIRPRPFNLVCIVCLLLVCSLFAVVLLLSSSSRGSLACLVVFSTSFSRSRYLLLGFFWFLFLELYILLIVSQMFLTKKPCRVPRVLDIVDCPAYNHEHEILYYFKFYDPLYYPELYPEIFATVDMVKQSWLEFSLASHVTVCGVCLAVSSCFISHIKFSVSWGEHGYLISSYVDGKFRQCVLSLEELHLKRAPSRHLNPVPPKRQKPVPPKHRRRLPPKHPTRKTKKRQPHPTSSSITQTSKWTPAFNPSENGIWAFQRMTELVWKISDDFGRLEMSEGKSRRRQMRT